MQLQLMQQFTRLLVFYGLVCWSSSYVIQGFRELESSSPSAGHGSVHVPGPDSCRFPTCMPSPSCPASSRSNTWRWYPSVSSAGFEAPSPDPDPGYHAPMLQWAYKVKLSAQESAHGHPVQTLEFWVERMIQQMKSSTKFLTTGCPEFLYVKGMLIDNRLAELRSQHINLKSFDDYIPNYQHRPFSGDGFDSGNGYDQLLGKGVAYSGVKKEWAVAVLSRLIQEDEMHEDPEVLPWYEAFRLELVEWPELTIREHVYAHAKGDTIFTSLGHKRSRTRESLHCLVWYTIGNVRSLFAGKIKCFLIIVGLTTRSGVPLPPLRVAVADFYPAKEVIPSYMYEVECMYRDPPADVQERDYPVLLGTMGTKVVHCRRGGADKDCFITYGNFSAQVSE
eukprot:gene26656-4026_t